MKQLIEKLFRDNLTPKQRRDMSDLRAAVQKERDRLRRGWSQHRPHPFCDCNQGQFNQNESLNNAFNYKMQEIIYGD